MKPRQDRTDVPHPRRSGATVERLYCRADWWSGGAILFNGVGFDRRSFRIGPAQPMVHGQIRYQISRGQGLQLAVRVQIRPDGS